jgi:hypothetical protein
LLRCGSCRSYAFPSNWCKCRRTVPVPRTPVLANSIELLTIIESGRLWVELARCPVHAAASVCISIE